LTAQTASQLTSADFRNVPQAGMFKNVKSAPAKPEWLPLTLFFELAWLFGYEILCFSSHPTGDSLHGPNANPMHLGGLYHAGAACQGGLDGGFDVGGNLRPSERFALALSMKPRSNLRLRPMTRLSTVSRPSIARRKRRLRLIVNTSQSFKELLGHYH